MSPESNEPNVSESPSAPSNPSAASTPSKRGGPLSGGLGILVFLVLMATAAYMTYRTLTTAERPTAEPVPAVFMCVETNKTFLYGMREGEQWPVVSPYTQKKTGYPTEQCYWTRDGKRKRDPTYVVLNEKLGKPGDTICPDCGHIVTGHNKLPPPEVKMEDGLPPPSSAPAKPRK